MLSEARKISDSEAPQGACHCTDAIHKSAFYGFPGDSKPALFGLFSLLTVLAHRLVQQGKLLARQTAWYAKPRPTFSDALALVRYELWWQPTRQPTYDRAFQC